MLFRSPPVDFFQLVPNLTDDALNANAVYVGCDFDFYGNRPLYSSYGTGSTFLGCTFNCKILNVEAEPTQFFTKEGGTITAVDCVYNSNLSVPISIGWTKTPSTSLKCYQSNIIHNGQSITIGGALSGWKDRILQSRFLLSLFARWTDRERIW